MLLPFKLAATEDKITSNAGLGLFGDFLHSQRFSNLIDENVRDFKSNHSLLVGTLRKRQNSL